MARKSIYPPSVTPGIPKLGNKPEGWLETTFGQVLQVVERKAQVHDGTKYQLVTAKRNRGGIVPRANLFGRDILTKTQFFIKAGDFLISKRQIIHGACGVVPPDLDGALVSNEYAALRVKHGLLLEFLNYFCHTVFFQQTCFQASVGVDVEKMIFNLRDWLKYKIYLPPLSEQQKIINILNSWDQAIILTEQRIEAAQQRRKAFLQQLLSGQQRFPEFRFEPWEEIRIGDIARVNPPKPKHLSDDALVSFIAMSDVSERGRVINMIDRPFRDVSSGYTPFQDGDILIAKITPCFENGKGALLSNLRNGCGFGSTEFHVIRADDPRVLPHFIYYHTLTHDFRGTGEMRMVGSAGQKRVRTDFVRNYRIMLPSVHEQCRIITVLQACDHEIDLLARKLEALLRQKRGLMQRLLTGRMRAKV